MGDEWWTENLYNVVWKSLPAGPGPAVSIDRGRGRQVRNQESEKGSSELLRLNDEFNLRSILINFHSYRGGAIGTKIFVLISLRQYQEQSFPHRDSCLTSGTVKRCCLEFFKIRFSHQILL